MYKGLSGLFSDIYIFKTNPQIWAREKSNANLKGVISALSLWNYSPTLEIAVSEDFSSLEKV